MGSHDGPQRHFNILRQHPDLVGIYANNDGMALGVVEAVKKAGKLKEVAIVGTDGIREAKRSIANGEMRATVAEFPYDEGKLGVEVALRILAGQPILWVVSPQAVITADNVKDFPNPPEFQVRGYARFTGRKTEMSGVESRPSCKREASPKRSLGFKP